MAETEENMKLREALTEAEKKYRVKIKNFHDYHVSEGRSGTEFTLETCRVSGVVGTVLARKIGKKYGVEFEEDSYTPEDMDRPLDKWCCYRAFAKNAEEVDDCMKRLVEAKNELSKKIDKYFDRLTEKAEKEAEEIMNG